METGNPSKGAPEWISTPDQSSSVKHMKYWLMYLVEERAAHTDFRGPVCAEVEVDGEGWIWSPADKKSGDWR